MNRVAILLTLVAVLTVAAAQKSESPPTHEHMSAMRGDIQKLNMSLNSIRSSIPRINDLDERNRWQQTIEMWQVVINHMQQMSEQHGAEGAPEAPSSSHKQ